jgi:hypothetical protein
MARAHASCWVTRGALRSALPAGFTRACICWRRTIRELPFSSTLSDVKRATRLTVALCVYCVELSCASLS